MIRSNPVLLTKKTLTSEAMISPMIAIISTIRRGGAVTGFAYGLLFLKEEDPWPKILCMAGLCTGLACLALA